MGPQGNFPFAVPNDHVCAVEEWTWVIGGVFGSRASRQVLDFLRVSPPFFPVFPPIDAFVDVLKVITTVGVPPECEGFGSATKIETIAPLARGTLLVDEEPL